MFEKAGLLAAVGLVRRGQRRPADAPVGVPLCSAGRSVRSYLNVLPVPVLDRDSPLPPSWGDADPPPVIYVIRILVEPDSPRAIILDSIYFIGYTRDGVIVVRHAWIVLAALAAVSVEGTYRRSW